METEPINLKIKLSNGATFDVTISKTATVLELKQACVEKSTFPVEQQRLIYKGIYRKNVE